MTQINKNIGLSHLVETKLDIIENSFQKAIIENKRIENKQELERKKLHDFKFKVKQRLILYKYAENKLNPNAQLNINLNDNKEALKKRLQNHDESRPSSRSRSASTFESSFSASDQLPKFVIHSMIDQYESNKQLSDERKRRISSMRKIYGNIERDKIKKIQFGKNSKRK